MPSAPTLTLLTPVGGDAQPPPRYPLPLPYSPTAATVPRTLRYLVEFHDGGFMGRGRTSPRVISTAAAPSLTLPSVLTARFMPALIVLTAQWGPTPAVRPLRVIYPFLVGGGDTPLEHALAPSRSVPLNAW